MTQPAPVARPSANIWVLARSCLLASLLAFGWLPVTLASPPCPLDQAPDSALQSALETALDTLQLDSAVADGRLSVALAILDDPAQPRLAQLNGKQMFYAASLPKIAILLAAAVEIDRGVLVLDDSLRTDLHDMIRISCNACATRVLDRVGRERLLEILEDPEYLFYDREQDGGLWVGKAFAQQPAYQRDPVAGKSHGANVLQVVRFYCALQSGKLVSPEMTALMLETLENPGIKHKFVKALTEFETDAVFRKSGTWKNSHADSAMVRVDGRTYVMVALARDRRGSEWLERLGKALHELAMAWQEPETR